MKSPWDKPNLWQTWFIDETKSFLMQLSLWTTQAKKTIEYVALDKRIHWKIRLAFLRMAYSGALGFSCNQQTKDAWLLR